MKHIGTATYLKFDPATKRFQLVKCDGDDPGIETAIGGSFGSIETALHDGAVHGGKPVYLQVHCRHLADESHDKPAQDVEG